VAEYINPNRPLAVVFDADGTLFDSSERRRLAGGDPDAKDFDWNKYLSNDAQRFDAPYPRAAEFVKRKAVNYQIIYLTGRLDSMRPGLEENLSKGGFPSGLTVMKSFKQRYMNSAMFKEEKLEELLKEYNIQEFYDDEEENILVARKLGIEKAILVRSQGNFWAAATLYRSCKQAYGHYSKIQRQIEKLKSEQNRILRTGHHSEVIYNDILECKSQSKRAMLYLDLFCSTYNRNPKLNSYRAAFNFPQMGDKVNEFTVVSITIQHKQISRFQEYSYPTDIIVQGKGDIWKSFGFLDNKEKVVYSEFGNPYRVTTGHFKYKRLKGGWRITSTGRAVRIIDLENPYSRKLSKTQENRVAELESWYIENGISSDNAKGMAYHNVLGTKSSSDIVVTVPHAAYHLEPGTHLTDWAAEPLARAIFERLSDRQYTNNPFKLSSIGEPLTVAVVGVITRLLTERYLNSRKKRENPFLLVGDIDRTVVDLNRPHAHNSKFYDKIRSSVKASDIVLDVHSYPPDGTKRDVDQWDKFDVVLLSVPEVTDEALLRSVEQSLSKAGFKVKVSNSAKWNWVQIVSSKLGGRPVLIECNEKHLFTGKIGKMADAIVGGSMKVLRGE
jgi:acid phosphatase class B